MTIEERVPTFFEWLLPSADGIGALVKLIIVASAVTFLGLFVSYLIAAVRHGPIEAFYRVAKVLFTGVGDLFRTSPRRVLAMARLAIQESIRRWVIVVFAIFIVVLLFAGWFVDPESTQPARLYINFVLTATNFFILVLAIVLSTFSLPSDIKNRTIYTVVTKPVRPSEIILGRIAGFAAVCTVLLVMMCGVSYGFVVRGLDHRHNVDLESEEAVYVKGADGKPVLTGWQGETTTNAHHKHTFFVDQDGHGYTNMNRGHRHRVERTAGADGNPVYSVGPPEDDLLARIPIYGELRFLEKDGSVKERGINVGDEWQYRSYIEGNAPGSVEREEAVWVFEGVTKDRFPHGLPVEMTIGVFRTYKGNIERQILGEIWLKHPSKNLASTKDLFESKEFQTHAITFSPTLERELTAADLQRGSARDTNRELDLFDLVDDQGRIEVHVACAERSQYFGMAANDMYLKAAEGQFWWNFCKGYISMWFQMVLVTTFGVMFSTFLNAPVALLASLLTLVFGIFKKLIVKWTSGQLAGGGSLVSAVRILRQDNVMVDLEMNAYASRTVKGVDWVVQKLIQGITELVPSYAEFSVSDYVALGFDINFHLQLIQGLTTIVFVVAVSTVGYFFLKTRELAA